MTMNSRGLSLEVTIEDSKVVNAIFWSPDILHVAKICVSQRLHFKGFKSEMSYRLSTTCMHVFNQRLLEFRLFIF